MTTIDHQQAAVEAMIEEAKNHRWLTIPDERQECDCGFVISAFPLEYGEDAYKSHVAEAALTAATPHLRAEFIAEVRRAQFEVEARHHFGFGEGGIKCLCGFESVRNRSRTEHITGAVLALLEGGGE